MNHFFSRLFTPNFALVVDRSHQTLYPILDFIDAAQISDEALRGRVEGLLYLLSLHVRMYLQRWVDPRGVEAISVRLI